MPLPLAGRTALVTGSGHGMGRSHAVVLAERGADVVVLDIDEEAAERTAEEVRSKGRRTYALAADIRDVSQTVAGIHEAVGELGPVSILVNNAGIGGQGLAIDQIDVDTFDDMYTTHVRGAFFITQAVVPAMKSNHYGRIINISSTFALSGFNSMSHYAAAKAALAGLTRSWALELAQHGITVNTVAPGTVETRITLEGRGKEWIEQQGREAPLGRIADVDDVSYAVAWLASDEAGVVTGQIISPNGGQFIAGA